MPKNLLFIVALITILVTAILTLAINLNNPESVSQGEIDTAVNQAQFIYRQEKGQRGFSNGPCLSDALMPGWVLDIAHNPRLPADDLPQNQCPSYIEGGSKHFVELDLEGNLIRAK